ncbi:MAG: bifunctional demethylmenaquinone methyltransferase/2-methoxy-6-polyprenyl-1,4-benzoquinol methylase UbiE [Chlamydiales bacterium]
MYHKSTPETIQSMFATIAPNYDRANTLFTFGIHKHWNQQLVKAVGPAKRLLDLCAGTGEIAFRFLRHYSQSEAILLDFCPEMLAVAERKGSSFKHRFKTIQGDAQAIALSDESVDSVTIAYGIRNVKEPHICFQEVHRVLRPKGRFGLLELTRPHSPSLQKMHAFYTNTLLPLLGKAAARNIHAYRYLANSIQDFVSPEEIEQSLKQCGFTTLKRRSLMGGIATLLLVEKTLS